MEQRIRIADSIRVLIPSITGIVLSLSYTSIRDGIFCIVLIIVIEILLRKRIVTMKIISSVLLMAAYVSLILYYIYLNSDVKLLIISVKVARDSGGCLPPECYENRLNGWQV